MSETKGVLIIGTDAVLTGDVKNSRRVEVHGKINGGVAADDVVVFDGGRLKGMLRSNSADIRGELDGEVRVQNLISIRSTGAVSGNVKYGKLAMEEGAELAAQVRNVPPSVGGDLDLMVARGQSVRITRADLSAYDPDDTADNLSFSVSDLSGGHLTSGRVPGTPVSNFTQADLNAGLISFAHGGGGEKTATFDVVVSDGDGATSGRPKTVTVAIRSP